MVHITQVCIPYQLMYQWVKMSGQLQMEDTQGSHWQMEECLQYMEEISKDQQPY